MLHFQVRFTGGDADDVVHNSAAAYRHREILLDMMNVCAKLWFLGKAPNDFLTELD